MLTLTTCLSSWISLSSRVVLRSYPRVSVSGFVLSIILVGLLALGYAFDIVTDSVDTLQS